MALPAYSKILLPTDGSDYSFYAAEHAVYLAKGLGAKLYALNVIDTGLAFHAGIHSAESITEMKQAGQAATGKVRELCAQNGVECEEIILSGRPEDIIVDVADRIGANCIVMGSIGMSAIERVLLGSVSDHVLKHASCPVLMVRKH